jgi:hypothetical protein
MNFIPPTSTNPGKSLIQNVLGNLQFTLLGIDNIQAFILREPEWEKNIQTYVDRISKHVDEVVQNNYSTEDPSLGTYLGIVRDVTLVCAAFKEDENPYLDLVKTGVSLNHADGKALRDMLKVEAEKTEKLAREKRQSMSQILLSDGAHVPLTIAAMGIIMTKTVLATSKTFQKKVEAKMNIAYWHIASNLLAEQLKEDASVINKAEGFATTLEDAGVTFDKIGNPIYSEEFLKKKAEQEENANRRKQSEGTTSQGTTVQGSQDQVSETPEQGSC